MTHNSFIENSNSLTVILKPKYAYDIIPRHLAVCSKRNLNKHYQQYSIIAYAFINMLYPNVLTKETKYLSYTRFLLQKRTK